MTIHESSPIITALSKKIITKYHPKKIILFGSHVWGTPQADSDVDLLVIKETTQPRLQRQRELYGLLRDRTVPLDLLVYTPAELEKKISGEKNLFLHDIITNGKIIYAAE